MTSKIMIVDDDRPLRILLEEVLVEEGKDVISAIDGVQAIEMASEYQLALILMDIQMPSINGVEAFIQIKKLLPECTVIFMTGHATGPLVETARSEGAKAVLTKPVSIERLLNMIEEVLPSPITS